MKKEESDLKIMEEMERRELQDRYIRFDWAIKRLLRQKANFGVLEGFLTVMIGEEVKILEILESEGNQTAFDDKFNRVDVKALNSKGEIIIVEVQNCIISNVSSTVLLKLSPNIYLWARVTRK